MQGRFGRRRIFGKREGAVLGIGAVALIVLSIKRRRTEGVSGEPYGNAHQNHQEEATFQREELAERAQQITRGGSARRPPVREEADKVSSETEQEVRRYLEDVEYPTSKDELVSTTKSNNAPEELIKRLVGLSIRDYASPEEVTIALNSRRGTGG